MHKECKGKFFIYSVTAFDVNASYFGLCNVLVQICHKQTRIQNPVKYLRWSVLQKQFNNFYPLTFLSVICSSTWILDRVLNSLLTRNVISSPAYIICELSHKLSNVVRLKLLVNQETLVKSQNWVETQSVAQLSMRISQVQSLQHM